MFSNSYQSGFISIFYSVGSNPLSLWDNKVKNGHIRRVIDDEVKSLVLEISGTNVATTYITCPILPRASLGIKLPFFVMVIKNLKKYFTFEIQILDDKDLRRRFRISNFQSTTKVRPFCTTMPIGLNAGWNQVQFNLADFTKRAYGSTYIETVRVQIHANARVRRLYFTDTLYSDEDMPNEFKLFGPPKRKTEIRPQKSGQPAQASTEKPTEEAPPPPSPSEMGPKTSPTIPEHPEEMTEEQVATEQEPIAAAPPPQEVPPEDTGEEFAEGVELVPMLDIDKEEMQWEEDEEVDYEVEGEEEDYEEGEELAFTTKEIQEGTVVDEGEEAAVEAETESPTVAETELTETVETTAEPTTTEEVTTTEVATTEEPTTLEEPPTETEGEGEAP